jgi:hypothetical protein
MQECPILKGAFRSESGWGPLARNYENRQAWQPAEWHSKGKAAPLVRLQAGYTPAWGYTSIVPSLRDSPPQTIFPGAAVPGYRLFRPSGTVSLVAGSSPSGSSPTGSSLLMR